MTNNMSSSGNFWVLIFILNKLKIATGIPVACRQCAGAGYIINIMGHNIDESLHCLDCNGTGIIK